MTGLDGQRVYLDWNATAPLRAEARAAMLAAMDAVGNPSSVHAEGRAARAIVERARAQVARLVGCDRRQVVFTSGATEANNMALDLAGHVHYAPTDHPSVVEPAQSGAGLGVPLRMRADGRVDLSDAALTGRAPDLDCPPGRRVMAVAAANGESGVVEDVREVFRLGAARRIEGHCDATQAIGRIPFAFRESGAWTAAISAHKLGGPKGAGALILRGTCAPGADHAWSPRLEGGGQEQGRRPGTENVVGLAGFGAAAEAAWRDLEDRRLGAGGAAPRRGWRRGSDRLRRTLSSSAGARPGCRIPRVSPCRVGRARRRSCRWTWRGSPSAPGRHARQARLQGPAACCWRWDSTR